MDTSTASPQYRQNQVVRPIEIEMATTDKVSHSSDSALKTSRAQLDASKLAFHLSTSQDTANVPISDCTDHMLICNWNEATGWSAPEIRPYGALSLPPSANILQYATGCFEGIKAYRGYDGKLRLFRLRLNCERMLKSSARVGLPHFDPSALEQLIHSFVAFEAEHWLPKDRVGETLYLRPTHIGTSPGLGLQKPRQSSLYLIATLTPGFSTNGGMKLVTSPADTFRAWPGGFGNAKLGANYGPTLAAHADAVASGFDQVLWLFGSEQYATEAGASNFFVIWKTRRGDLELVTAGLESKTILEEITRRSIIELVQCRRGDTQNWVVDGTTLEPLTVVERDFSINEIREAIADGRLLEAFASGTAYFVAPIRSIRHRDEDLDVPCDNVGSGYYAALIKGWLSDIVYGTCEFLDWTKVVEGAHPLP